MKYSAYISIFLVGLSFGMTACMLSCMPFLTPILLNNSNSIKQSMGVMLPFSLGRVFTYVIIAIIASSSSILVKNMIDETFIYKYILGSSTIFLGIYMLYNNIKNNKTCGIKKGQATKKDISKFGYFGLGATISINLCAPILTLISLSGNTTTIYSAIALGLSFGMGAVFFTLFFYGFFLSTLIRGILEQFINYKKAVETTASLLLILVGVLIISGNISL